MRIIIGILCVCQVLAIIGAVNVLKEVQTGIEQGVDIAKEATFGPGIKDLITKGKDLIFGAPIALVLEALNQVCSLALATEGNVNRAEEVIPDLGNVHLWFMDHKYNRSFDIDSLDELLRLDTFNRDNPTVILTTGWLSMEDNKTNSAFEEISRAYRCRGEENFFLFDSAEYIATIYSWSAVNTETLGKFLGKFLAKMTDTIDAEQVHLIGHSLGAQISGAAGRHYQEITDQILPRITALDPARPCFNEGEALNGVGRGDARFVDVIHSNNGALGQRNPVGDADFYPNGVVILQPGSFDIGTSHARAYKLYAESVLPGNENTFMATKCNSMYSLNRGLCKKGEVPMGYASLETAKGNFFVKTRSKAPYGSTRINTCGGQPVLDDDDEEEKDEKKADKEKTDKEKEKDITSTTESNSGTSSSSTTISAKDDKKESKYDVDPSSSTEASPSKASTTTKRSKLLSIFG